MTEPTLHTRLIGDSGSPVVFLHGLFGQGRNFTQIAKGLEPEFRSLLVDLPDHGRSPWTERVDYMTMADTVAETISQAFPGQRVHLVGHSMGGKVAMVTALRHPGLIDRLVIVDIAPAISEGSDEFEHLLGSLAAIDLDSLERRTDADAALVGRIDDERVRGFLLQNLRPADGGFAWQANLSVLRRDLDRIGGFPEIDAVFDRPTLWVAGERSHYIRPEHTDRMRELFPRTTQVTVKGAGHWVHSEQPDSFIATLRAFLGSDR
ncbi:alpha/beta hydrolase [Aeromicrobium sp. PE09-221]|uniref:alpha/beta fold hydrolase n=1 Tax=Aeromicrobium sp. PE09-221 TaxID=1898043 RepID=UPI000B73E5B0|nr:alpha/beta fold hydrolase [Aeromicrobium sp. PE09-221]OUZ08260.1 alpha/beta hydrolase [Aeromicrobium sp. PE09-221]